HFYCITMLTIITLRRITSKVVSRSLFSTAVKSKRNVDPVQESFLEEKCFLVDEKDSIIGQASKRDCHLVRKDGDILLHRAFSVFLFNKKRRFAVTEAITYPNMYTNTCCSHPVADFAGEDEEADAIGVRRAARRRLNYELGIPLEQIPLENLNYITRIYYKDEGNGKWGEHEIDYVLFFQGDVKVKPNSNEISEISFVPRNELDDYIPTLSGPMTPWFQMILKHRLRFWWDNLDNLEEIRDHKNILKLKL
ncbi:hypothetical protein NQ315_009876, partial [Exocentrus adspersus]